MAKNKSLELDMGEQAEDSSVDEVNVQMENLTDNEEEKSSNSIGSKQETTFITDSDTIFTKEERILPLTVGRETDTISSTQVRKGESSYKNRLRDHINTVRERAAESASRPQSRSQSRMRMMLNKPARSERVEDLLRREERDLAAAWDRHRKLSLQPTEKKSEGQSFFTYFEEVVADPGSSPTPTIDSGNGKIAAAECLSLQPDEEQVVWAPARHTSDFKQRRQLLICQVQSKTEKAYEKLEQGNMSRHRASDGLYVEPGGSRPRWLIQRLLKDTNASKWFKSDGQLLTIPCELVYKFSTCQTHGASYLIFRLPTLPAPLPPLAAPSVLDVQLLVVRFSHHSLFSREHVLAQRLQFLWHQWLQQRRTDPWHRLHGQLDATRRARDKAPKDEWPRWSTQIAVLRSRWFAAGLAERQMEERLQATWRDLLRLRVEQGFRNTGIQLIIKEEIDSSMTQQTWDKLLQTEINEERQQEAAEIDDIDVAIRDKFCQCFRGPGEPKLNFSLTDLGPPTTSSDVREEERRAAVQKCWLYVKLFSDGVEVYHSSNVPVSPDFTVHLGERFAIRLMECPRSLSMQLMERGGLSYQVYLPVPDSLATLATVEVENIEFGSGRVVACKHAGVGCGQELVPCPGGSEWNNRPVCLYAAGIVSCRLGWVVDPAGHIMAPLRNTKTVSKYKVDHVIALQEWAEKACVDPNDPNNADLFRTIKQSSAVVDATELELCPTQVITGNARLRLLTLRDRLEPEFRGYHMIPLCEKVIHPDVFKAYEARVAQPEQDAMPDSHLDGRRELGRRRMNQVRQTMLQRCRQVRQHRRLADLVWEERVPDLGTLGLTLMRWLRPKRRLRPERKQRKKVPVQHLMGGDVSIVVNVVRAFQVPVRTDVDELVDSCNIDGFCLVNVRPFVSASFRGENARTTAAEGANPTWNQELVLPIHSSPGELAAMKESLRLNLFDEVVVDLVEDVSQRDVTVHQRLERHWLAGLDIPFSALHSHSRIEGTFQLESPPVLLGYSRSSGALPHRDATHLTLFITVQPALNPPEQLSDLFETKETIVLEGHLRGWQTEVAALFPLRKVQPVVNTAAGIAVCVTRLVRPLAPPLDLPDPASPGSIARFVSRIPTNYDDLLDVWLTCDQVIGMMSGSSGDHAVLLCCFLLHLGLPAFVLQGSGIPHGNCSYVLVNTSGQQEQVWDASNGRVYSVRDSFCPLHKVYALFNNENIWANIQQEDTLRRLRFDVSKRADWLPAFNKNITAPIDSIQPERVNYTHTSKQAVQALQDKLESRLRDSLMRWRPRMRTNWNKYCAATMRKLLPSLEEALSDVADHCQALSHIITSHKMCGFPINMAYTDTDAVLETVKATGVHCTESEHVEFALAVYIHPYPCDVLSVWVYLASLTRRR